MESGLTTHQLSQELDQQRGSRHQRKIFQKKGAMFWCAQWNALGFNCVKCLPTTSMYRYLEKAKRETARRISVSD